jgi:hypothetical protein
MASITKMNFEIAGVMTDRSAGAGLIEGLL